MDGLPYEFYRAIEAALLPVLLNVAFCDVGNQASLTVLLRGVICLIKKAHIPAEELTSYRPNTLLNCDAKLVMHPCVQSFATLSGLRH